MKQIFISLLLFSLLIALAISMDLIQGLGVGEILRAFMIIGEQINGEGYVIMIVFFLPLIFSKAYNYFKTRQS